MAEAAAKEPSMEDILSSIRKIIAEEETAEAMVSDHGAQDHAAQPQAVPEPVADVSMQDIRPSIEPHQTAQAEAEPQQVYEEQAPAAHAEPVAQARPPEVDGMSLASIAANLQGAQEAPPHLQQVVAPQASEPVAEAPQTLPMDHAQPVEIQAEPVSGEPVHQVNMSEAAPAPQPVAEASSPAVPVPTREDMAREEEAFRGALMSPSADGAVSGSFERLKRSAEGDVEAQTEAILRPMLREWLDENLPSLVERLVREEIERVARG
ncbi:MAG: DUF2497 domain-containing protein [Pseudomonadota bacterium]